MGAGGEKARALLVREGQPREGSELEVCGQMPEALKVMGGCEAIE